MPAFIVGSGSCLPEREVTNEELAPQLGTTSDRILESSGIRRRRWAKAGTTTSSLASTALQHALEDCAMAASEVDYLIFGTMTPDRFIPGSGPSVQKQLGLREIPCLDIRDACCNLLYGLQVASALVMSGAAKNLAICLAEIQSPWLDISPAAATTSMLFGDGAAAIIISTDSRKRSLEVLDVFLATDGSYVDDLGIRCPGTEFSINAPAAGGAEFFLPRMVGQSVILHASRKMVSACEEVLRRNGLTPNDVRWLVPHQANANLLVRIARSLGLPEDRIISIIESSGNTSSASMGLALDTLRQSNRLQERELVLLPAFGAGFTWGAGLCRA